MAKHNRDQAGVDSLDLVQVWAAHFGALVHEGEKDGGVDVRFPRELADRAGVIGVQVKSTVRDALVFMAQTRTKNRPRVPIVLGSPGTSDPRVVLQELLEHGFYVGADFHISDEDFDRLDTMAGEIADIPWKRR